MIEIGEIIQTIFDTNGTYDRYVEENEGRIGDSGRLVSNQEYDMLRQHAMGASLGVGASLVLPTWSPRFHIARARRAFSEMRAAHDKLFNVLDAYLAWANANTVAQSQYGVLQQEPVLKRAERQAAVLARIKAARAVQRTNAGNALRAAEDLSNKYIREPFQAPAQDKRNQAYYDAVFERVRYNDLLNQKASLDIADLYDELALHGIAAEAHRDLLEFQLVGLTVGSLMERQELLGFDFTARIVDAIADVLQNAMEIVRVVTALWGLERLEQLAPNYRSGRQIGWYFGLAPSLWPSWIDKPRDKTTEILFGDALLAYLDKADVILDVFERRLQEFDANAVRTMFRTKLSFKGGADGVSRATLTIPNSYRYQEVSAIYLKDMSVQPASIEARIKAVRSSIIRGANGSIGCEARPEDSELGDMAFGSDGGLSGEAPIYALERDCLASSSAGNLAIVLVCKGVSPADFEADCIVRVAGFNNPAG